MPNVGHPRCSRALSSRKVTTPYQTAPGFALGSAFRPPLPWPNLFASTNPKGPRIPAVRVIDRDPMAAASSVVGLPKRPPLCCVVSISATWISLVTLEALAFHAAPRSRVIDAEWPPLLSRAAPLLSLDGVAVSNLISAFDGYLPGGMIRTPAGRPHHGAWGGVS